jgi:cytoskeletal protein CcmA (bactofilin family)
MIWEKKSRPIDSRGPEAISSPVLENGELPVRAPLGEQPGLEDVMHRREKTRSSQVMTQSCQTTLGRSTVFQGHLTGNEDLLIEGQFEGNIDVQDHSLTVGIQGQVNAEIRARQVIVSGRVDGNISASERIELRKSGSAVGKLVSAGVAFEEGAYFKGSIEIVRESDEGKAPEYHATAELSHALAEA